jgi:hypothetical protein
LDTNKVNNDLLDEFDRNTFLKEANILHKLFNEDWPDKNHYTAMQKSFVFCYKYDKYYDSFDGVNKVLFMDIEFEQTHRKNF